MTKGGASHQLEAWLAVSLQYDGLLLHLQGLIVALRRQSVLVEGEIDRPELVVRQILRHKHIPQLVDLLCPHAPRFRTYQRQQSLMSRPKEQVDVWETICADGTMQQPAQCYERDLSRVTDCVPGSPRMLVTDLTIGSLETLPANLRSGTAKQSRRLRGNM